MTKITRGLLLRGREPLELNVLERRGHLKSRQPQRATGVGLNSRRNLFVRQVDFDRLFVIDPALNLVARHADASEVILSVERSNGHVTLRVRDDGRGVGDETVEGGGLRGIREHALIVGGALSIDSEPGSGLEIALEAPVALPREPSPR